MDQYAPILKAKEGEFLALSKLPDNIKDSIVPIVDIVPNPIKLFNDHIKATLKYFNKWPKNRLMYIDGYLVQGGGRIVSDQHYLNFIFSELRNNGFKIIPVVSNIANSEYAAAVKTIISKDHKGICIRIFRSGTTNINVELDAIQSNLGIDPSVVDLLLDLGSVEDLSAEEIFRWALNKIAEIRGISTYRSLIVSGSSFPIDLVKLKADQVHIIPRNQWLAWQQLYSCPDIGRIPSYSDYAISHPQMSEFGKGIPNASASIRYTHELDYIVYRGKGTRQHSFDQFYSISESLLNSTDFYGANHCAGDDFIKYCGTKKEKTGNLETWRWVGTSHHITIVVNQLRQLWRDFNA